MLDALYSTGIYTRILQHDAIGLVGLVLVGMAIDRAGAALLDEFRADDSLAAPGDAGVIDASLVRNIEFEFVRQRHAVGDFEPDARQREILDDAIDRRRAVEHDLRAHETADALGLAGLCHGAHPVFHRCRA